MGNNKRLMGVGYLLGLIVVACIWIPIELIMECVRYGWNKTYNAK